MNLKTINNCKTGSYFLKVVGISWATFVFVMGGKSQDTFRGLVKSMTQAEVHVQLHNKTIRNLRHR